MVRPAVLRAVALTSATVATLAAFRSALLTSMSRLQSPHAGLLDPEHALARRVPAIGDPTPSSSSEADTISDNHSTSDIVSSTSSQTNGGSPTTSSSTETSSQTSKSTVGSPSLSSSTSATSTSSAMSSTTFIDSFSSSSTTDSLTTATTWTNDPFTPSPTTSSTQTETSFTYSSSSTSFTDSFTSTSTTTTGTGDFTTSHTTVSATTSKTESSASTSSPTSSFSDSVTSSTIPDSETTTTPVSTTSTITISTDAPSQTSLTNIVSSSISVPSDSATSPGQETSSSASRAATGSSAVIASTQLPSSSWTDIPPPVRSSSDATTSTARPSAPPDETGIVFSQSGASSSGSPLPSIAEGGGGDGFWHNSGAVAGVFIPLAFAIGGLVFLIGKYLNNRKQNARMTPYHAVPGGNGSGAGLDMENRPFIPAAPISPFYYDPYVDNDATHHSQPLAPNDQPWQRYSDDPRPLERSNTVFSNPSVYSQEGVTSPTDPVLRHEHMQGIGAHGGGQSAGFGGLSNSNPGGVGGGASQGHAPNMGGSTSTAPNAGGLGGGYNAPVPTQTSSYGASPYLPVIVPPLGYLSTHVEESEPESEDEEQIGGGPPLRIRNRRRFDENSCIDEPARARLLEEPEP